jgi:CBS domain-containing protein
MRENGINRMPVVNDDGSLFGIVCADDLLSFMSDEISNLAKITVTQIKKEQAYYGSVTTPAVDPG